MCTYEQVSPEETEVLEEIKQLLGEDDNQDSESCIAPFPLLTKNAVEALRYRAEVRLITAQISPWTFMNAF